MGGGKEKVREGERGELEKKKRQSFGGKIARGRERESI